MKIYLSCLLLVLALCACNESAQDTQQQRTEDTPLNNHASQLETQEPISNTKNVSLSNNDKALLQTLNFPAEPLHQDASTLPSQQPATLKPEASATFYNHEAVIPPQCYTKHDSEYNPCMTCHQTYKFGSRPNSMNDGNLQMVYAFSDEGLTNHWKNLFEDRRERIATMDDQAVIDYIYTDNYSPLIQRIKNTEDWNGPLPAITNLHKGAQAFDDNGFAKDGSQWVAFNYTPLPSTFWPTNGSTDDVMIRLPSEFRQSACPSPSTSRDTYLANLSILEAAIKDLPSITTPEIDETAVCQDLNNDGELGLITSIIRPDFYVGQASDTAVSRMLYPEGTEFLHTVRYVGITDDGGITVAPRMKEVRYMKKHTFFSPTQLAYRYGNEQQEKIEGELPSYVHRGDNGTDNDFGWTLLGFIEAKDGQLRQQTPEEHLFCMGCHTTIGSTIDQTFAFARKVTGAKGWSYIDLHGMKDSHRKGSPEGEIAHYLRTVGGGNEFRENEEIQQRFFDQDGKLVPARLEGLDVYQLITPSPRRALDLNKAYMTIVEDQDFIHGRDANLSPATNVHHSIDPATTPTLPAEKAVLWDMRLGWSEN